MNIYANIYKGEKRSKGSFGSLHNPPVCTLHTKEIDGVTLVYADVISENALDPDFGVGIDIELPSCRYMADHKRGQFWCQPYFDTDPFKIPAETQLLVCEKEDGSFLVILPVVGETYRCALQGKDKYAVTARLHSNYAKLPVCNTLAFVMAEGKDPHSLIESCVKAALDELGNKIPHRSQRCYPEAFAYLGWCSWDAMQIRVTHEGLLQKCREFKEKKIPIRWVLLDDMWGHVRDFYGKTYNSFGEMCRLMHASALYDYEADPLRFPKGLAACLADIKEMGYMTGIWYPTTGYWRGIEWNSPAYEKLKPYLLETDDGIFVPDFLYDKSYDYYRTINQFLRECGADFIKIDNQSMSERFYNRLAPIGKAARSFHNGMEDAVMELFGDSLINCMGMSSEDMWNRKGSAISRCSDDFQPENRAWFAKHICQCAYNSLLQGQFYWCDWDMWWTDDGQAKKNSLARAVSGGPIYVSDQSERSNAELLAPLALSDGRILRCDNPATPTVDCICQDPTSSDAPVKLQNICRGSGVLALFNLNGENKPVKGSFSPAEIQGLCGNEFVIYSHFTKQMQIVSKNEKVHVILADNDDMALYIIVPYRDGFAPIGRTDKFISPATVKAVTNGEMLLEEEGPAAYVKDGILYFCK